MVRHAQSLIFLSAILLLPACFKSRANWQPYGERASLPSLKVTNDYVYVPHGSEAVIGVSGGSGQYKCTLVSTQANIGAVEMKNGETPRCIYSAPVSGQQLSVELRLTDAVYPERYAITSVTVPASGLPDSSLNDAVLPNFTGKILGPVGRDTEVADIKVDKQGRYLVGYNVLENTTPFYLAEVGVTRFLPSGEKDATFGNSGTYGFAAYGTGTPCGTGGGSPVTLKKIEPEKSGNGVRVAFEALNSTKQYVVRLDDNGVIDMTWGGQVLNGGLGTGSGGGNAIPMNGCSMISGFNGTSSGVTVAIQHDLSTMELDADDYMYFGAITGISPIGATANLRMVYPHGDKFREKFFSPNSNYSFSSLYNNSRHSVFINPAKPGHLYSAAPIIRNSGNVAGIGVWDWIETATTLSAGDTITGGFAFLPTTVDVAGSEAEETPWQLRTIAVTPSGGLLLGGYISFHDNANGTDLNLFTYGKTSPVTEFYLGAQDASGAVVVPPSKFSSRTFSIPFASLYRSFPKAGGTNLDVRGLWNLLLQPNGGILMLGTSDDDAHNQAAVIGRVSPLTFNGDSDFATGYAISSGNIQLPYDAFTGQESSFRSSVLLPDGRYLAGGHMRFSTYNPGRKTGWVGRFWP